MLLNHDLIVEAALMVPAQFTGPPIPAVYDSTADIIRTAALLLAIILPIVGTIWSTRREGRKSHEQMPTVGRQGLIAIGGALASQGDTLMYIEALEKHSKSLDLQTEALSRLAESNLELVRNEKASALEVAKAAEESTKIRKALEEISDLIRRRITRDTVDK